MSNVVTWNISPAPSQSDPVIIGVCTYLNPRSWKNLCIAYDNAENPRKSNEVIVTTKSMPVARMFGQYEKKQIAVVARQLRKDEKMNNYESKANEKYDEIKKIVEGDGNNEKA